MSKTRRHALLKILESGFLTVGILLLVAFGLLRFWGDYQSKADIRAFEQSVASETMSKAENGSAESEIAQSESIQIENAESEIAESEIIQIESAEPEIAESEIAQIESVKPKSIKSKSVVSKSIDAKIIETELSEEPDYTHWSPKRVNDYHESNEQRKDAPLGILSISKLDLKVPIYNGTDEINLNRGAGRIKGTARIDSPGNLGLAAHRDGFFRVLKDIEIGDSIDMLTRKGKKEFVVSSITIVDPSDVSVLAPTEDATITLVTCYPFYFVGHAPKRYIVKGELRSNQINKS